MPDSHGILRIYNKGKHTVHILALSSEQPCLVSEFKHISEKWKPPRTGRNATPGAFDVSDSHDDDRKA